MSLTDWDTWVPVIVGVVGGILVQVVSRILDRRERIPVLYQRTTSLVSSVDDYSEDIQVFYKRKPVPQVSLTRLGFANIGKGSIPKQDVRKTIRVSFGDDTCVLRTPKVLRVSRVGSNLKATKDGNTVKLTFDDLDYMDGAVVEVLHTGDAHGEIQVEGTIRSVPKGIRQISPKYAQTSRRKWLLLPAMASLGILVYLCIALAPGLVSDISEGKLDARHIWALVIAILIALAYLLLFLMSFIEWRRTLPSKLSLDDPDD